VEQNEPLSKEQAQEIVDIGSANFYQKHNGELVQEVKTFNSREEAIDWLHENDYW
jgi:hypothetical protein